MSDCDIDDIDELESKLLKARCRLLTREPWYGHCAMSMVWLKSDMPWTPDEQSKTMGVRVVGGGEVQCLWYPGFVRENTVRELYGVIQHEIEHIVRCHCIRCGLGREHERWNIACCKPDELIVGGRNTVIAELQTGDMVYGQNGREVAVITPMSRHHEGQMIQLKGRYLLPFSLTPEHPVLVAKWRLTTTIINGVKTTIKQFQEPEFIEAGQLTGCASVYGHPARSGYSLVVPKYAMLRNDIQLDLTPYIVRPGDGSIKTTKLILDEDMSWLFGVYIAEGSPASADLAAGCKFSLGAHEEDLASEICRILGSYGFNPGVVIDGSRLYVQVSSPILARAFSDWFGRGAANKSLPDFLRHHSSSNIVNALFRGYFAGDGHNSEPADKVRNNAGTVSRLLALQLQTLGFTHGIPFGLYQSERPERTIDNKTLPPETCYVLSADSWQARNVFRQSVANRQRNHYYDAGQHVYVPLVRVGIEEYSGPVCNVETTDHTYLVSNAVVHNCDMIVNGKKSAPICAYHDPSTNEHILPAQGNGVYMPEDWDTGLTTEQTYEKMGGVVQRCPKCGGTLTGKKGPSPGSGGTQQGKPGKKSQAQGKGQCQGKGQKGQGQGSGSGQGNGQGTGQGSGGSQSPGQGSGGTQGSGQGHSCGGTSGGHCCSNCGGECDEHGNSTQGAGRYEYGEFSGRVTDNHDIWQQTDASEDEVRQIAKDMTDRATEKCQGTSPGHLTSVLAELAKPIVRWRELLRCYLGNHVGNRRITYSRRNRRNDAFGLPGISHHAAGRVCVIVDTSGSISDMELMQFFTEIEMISSRALVYVLQWDYNMQGYDKYKRNGWKKFKIKGRGGTDMAGPVLFLTENRLVPDCTVMLTDGYCNWAPSQPWFPERGMITVITSGKDQVKPPDWGQVVWIKHNRK